MAAACRWVIELAGGNWQCLLCGLAPCAYKGDRDKCSFEEYVAYNPDEKLRISEIYPAVSGEGTSTGCVCTIVRTVECNLRCRYCDSTYAYEGGQEVTIRDIIEAILKFGISTILFTGGEPLLHEKGASNFLRAMLEHRFTTYVETNGSIDIRPFKLLARIVMDIKTPSSGMHEKTNWDNLSYIGPNDEVKFVVSNEEDYNYTVSVISKYGLYDLTPNVFISPVWSDDKELSQNLSQWMIRDRSEARLMLQQHKCIWGPKERGV